MRQFESVYKFNTIVTIAIILTITKIVIIIENRIPNNINNAKYEFFQLFVYFFDTF